MDDLLKPLTFPHIAHRPYFFTSYVSTIDGKIFVNRPGYWPIGSRNDYTFFTFLRAHADVIVEGKNTVLRFGKYTIDTIHREDFLQYRKQLGKTEQIKHIVVTSDPNEELFAVLKNEYGFRSTILTSSDVTLQSNKVEFVPVGADEAGGVSIEQVVDYLSNNQINLAFLDTGPTMFMSFLQNQLVDEIFLTLAPKIFGNIENTAITLGETGLFGPEFVPTFTLANVQKVENEVFMRYLKDVKT